jgi:hypothetical protein
VIKGYHFAQAFDRNHFFELVLHLEHRGMLVASLERTFTSGGAHRSIADDPIMSP